MRGADYKPREDRWAIYHDLERKEKRRLLARLSENDGFTLLHELDRFAPYPGSRMTFGRLDMIKIGALSKIRALFGKVSL